MKIINKTTSAAILAALAIATAQSASAADIKNWPKWMQPKQSQPTMSTPTSPAKAMDCSQCTSATVVAKRDLVAGKSGHGYRYVSQTVHQCGGCRDALARKSGTKTVELAHYCSAVGRKSPLLRDTTRQSWMNQNDDKLRVLLKRWQDIEPAGNFEANVRRRIRLAAAESPRQSWLAGLLWRPAFAMAVVVSVLAGTSAGILSSHQQRTEMKFMSAGTLAGGYARLTTEGRR